MLLDPNTGEITERWVSGLNPFGQASDCTFQPTGQEHVLWLAWTDPADRRERNTYVTRYDLTRLASTKCLAIEGVRFGSDDMWVDAKRKLVYFLHVGVVLTVPLPDFIHQRPYDPMRPRDAEEENRD